MGQVSVPFWHAPGGAIVFQKGRDAVPIRKVVVLRSLGNFENRTSWGCRTASRRLRSRLCRLMDAVRPRVPHRCVPKSGAGSDVRFSGGAQEWWFSWRCTWRESCSSRSARRLRKLFIRDVAAVRPILLACSLCLDMSRRLGEAALLQNAPTNGDRLLELAGRRLHCYCKTHER